MSLISYCGLVYAIKRQGERKDRRSAASSVLGPLIMMGSQLKSTREIGYRRVGDSINGYSMRESCEDSLV